MQQTPISLRGSFRLVSNDSYLLLRRGGGYGFIFFACVAGPGAIVDFGGGPAYIHFSGINHKQRSVGDLVIRRCVMKHLLISFVLVACLAAGANAHSGMFALFADTNNQECHANVGVGQTASLYLVYVRGDGPQMGQGYEFKLLRSSAGTVFLQPTWPSSVLAEIALGTIETGISLFSVDCFPNQDYTSLGTIPIMNVSDPDTFTVQVVPDPEQVPEHAIVFTTCEPYPSIYVVSGGTFVFNAGCHTPEDPFGVLAVKETTWGAIKELYR
jgi:hypothetical protein